MEYCSAIKKKKTIEIRNNLEGSQENFAEWETMSF